MNIDDIKEEYDKLFEENEVLKDRLNDVCFGGDGDIEAACRYLHKIGYIGFDDDTKEYINLHNDQFIDYESKREKLYCIKDEELSEYTRGLEEQNEKLKSEIKDNECYKKWWKGFKQSLRSALENIYIADMPNGCRGVSHEEEEYWLNVYNDMCEYDNDKPISNDEY